MIKKFSFKSETNNIDFNHLTTKKNKEMILICNYLTTILYLHCKKITIVKNPEIFP